jgi:hypothetical protein
LGEPRFRWFRDRLFSEFFFGGNPVIDIFSVFAAALKIQLMSSAGDLFSCWFSASNHGNLLVACILSTRTSQAPDPIALCVGVVTIVAAFNATTPTNTRFGINILSAIQPVVVFRALHCVYARLVDGVYMVRHCDEHVISMC